MLMLRKPPELPLEVALAFARDVRAFFKAKDQLEQDEIASRQLHTLWAFHSRGSRAGVPDAGKRQAFSNGI